MTDDKYKVKPDVEEGVILNLARVILGSPILADFAKTILSWKIVSSNPLLAGYVMGKCRKLQREIAISIPQVYIETTLACNARCVMCRHGYEKMTGQMQMDLFCKIIDECFLLGIKAVGLSVYGEPLADKLLFERISYLREKGMAYSFYTNGSLLDEEKAVMLFELGGLMRINFSLNAFSSETYRKVTGMDCRDRTYDNVLRFLALKDKYKREDLDVGVSLVRINANKDEVDEFLRFWKSQRQVTSFTIGDLWERVGGWGSDVLGSVGRLHKAGKSQLPCLALWRFLIIYCDGRVAPCCDDADERGLIVGDVSREKLIDIWRGEKLSCLRQMHLSGCRIKHAVCGVCNHNYYL